uniref:Putative DNA repair protein n=1 Tax=viral metagenome TaxID=1070528 RepID=A0A6M3X4L3_9ZZZZ
MKRVIKFREDPDEINDSKRMFEQIKHIEIDYGQENMLVFFLNTRNKLISYEVMFKGGLSATMVDPRTVFRRAIQHNSNSIIMAHNHPSDNLKPSADDYNIFQRFKKAGDIIGISVLDSIIFNKTSYYSMNDKGK